jgi:phosphohistidine phosphatase
MKLVLVRHGIAIDRDDPHCPPDPERRLTPEGIARTRSSARGFASLNVKPEILLTSPYARASETAAIFAEALGLGAAAVRATEALTPDAPAAAIVRELARLRSESVACFGHASHLDEVIATLVGTRAPVTALKKAGAACLDVSSFSPPRGAMVWLATGKMLRRCGG